MTYEKGCDLKPILIVEDNPLFGSLVCKMIRQQLSQPLIWVQTFAEAKEQIAKYEADFRVALLDLNLPDAEMGKLSITLCRVIFRVSSLHRVLVLSSVIKSGLKG